MRKNVGSDLLLVNTDCQLLHTSFDGAKSSASIRRLEDAWTGDVNIEGELTAAVASTGGWLPHPPS